MGNDILSDDAIGLRAAQAAGKVLEHDPNVAVVLSPEMGLSLLDDIVGFENLVIVDAVETGQVPPGSIHEFDATELPALPAVSPHFLGIGEVLALGRKLEFAVPARVKILAVEVRDTITVSTGMTPAVEAALPEIVNRVVLAVRGLAETR